MVDNQSNPKNIEYYYKNNRFLGLLKSTGKWKDLIAQKEAIIALFLSAGSSWMIHEIYRTLSTKDFVNLSANLILVLVAGMLGMLGFLVGGMAILSGTISNKILRNINAEKKFNHLMGIVFTFYLDGVLIGVTLILFIFVYLALQTEWAITNLRVWVVSIFSAYFFWFTVVYSILLLGTLLRLIILTYRYTYDEKQVIIEFDKIRPKSQN